MTLALTDSVNKLEAVGADQVVTVDVHNLAAFQNAFRIVTEHVEARPLFVERCGAFGDRPLAVVSPDPGGFHRAEALRDALERTSQRRVELAMLGKHRKGGVVRSEAFVGDVAGRIAVIVDDLIVTGTTLVRAATACRERGAIAVHAMATHALFTAETSTALATPLIEDVVVTDTISPTRTDLGPVRSKVTVLSIAPLLGRTIQALHLGQSITEALAL